MASIGGMDLPYGSQTQLVRTTVALVETDTTGVTAATARKTAGAIIRTFPSVIRPDYVCFATATITSGYQAAGYATLFDNDNTGDGDVDNTGVTDGAGTVLRTIKEVPAAGATVHPTGSFTSAGLLEDGTSDDQAGKAANAALGASGGLSGNMSYDGILNVGVVHAVGGSEAVDDLFAATTANATAVGGGADPVVLTQYQSGVTLQSQLMKSAHDEAISGQAVDQRVYALDLSAVLPASGTWSGGTALAEADLSGLSADAQSTTFATVSTALGGACSVISVLSVCKTL